MSIIYKLKKNIVGRTAANLVFNLCEAKGVRIIKKDRCFNGKSLLGILANNLEVNDEISVAIDEACDISIVKKAFQELGEEVK